MLKGYKTYIICVLALLVLVLVHYGIVPANYIETIFSLLGIGTVAALRSAIK